MRRYRAKKRNKATNDAETKHINRIGRTETTADGRVSARKPPPGFEEDGWYEAIADGNYRFGEVAEQLGTSAANVSRWFEYVKRERAIQAEAATWTMSDEAREALGDFRTFRERYFTVARGRFKGQPYVTTDFHLAWINAVLDTLPEEAGGQSEPGIGGQQLILSPPRHGKALDDDTPMMTSAGWKRMGDINVGDEVVGSDGRFTKVTGVFPQGTVPAYQVRFSDGSTLVACADHQWQVEQRYGAPPTVRTTDQLADDLTEADGRLKWRIPMMDPLEGVDRHLPLDPYLLGCWLGDGTTTRGEITTADPEILAAFNQDGFADSYSYDQTSGRAATYGLPGLVSILRDLGVLGDKHIPDEYLTSSVAQRLALLQGLCDTDGSAAKNGSQQSYCTTSPALAAAFKTLVASLGGTWTERVRPAAARTAWEVWFRLPAGMEAFRLARKGDRMAPRSARNIPRRLVASIEPAQPRPMTCISVDATDHLYAAGTDFVVTHNTELIAHFCIWLIVRNPDIIIIWIAKAERQAKEVGSLIRDQLERNEQLAADFLGPGGTFKPKTRSGAAWRDDEFEVASRTVPQKAPTFRSIGRGGNLQSVDADLIVTDDIEDHDSTRTPHQREATREWLLTEVESRKEMHTAWLCIGSRNHPKDVLDHLLGLDDWNAIVESAHDRDCEQPIEDPQAHTGCMLWPDKFPYSELLKKIANSGETIVQMRYLNDPVGEGIAVFDEQAMRSCLDRSRVIGQIDLPAGFELLGSIDPSPGTHQVAQLWAWSRERPERFLVDIHAGKGGMDAWDDLVRSWLRKYQLHRWVVEGNSSQIDYINRRAFVVWCQNNGVHIHAHITGRNKHSVGFGVVAMHPLYVNKQIVLPYGDPETKGKVDRFIAEHVNYDPDRTQRETKWRVDRVVAAWFANYYIDTLQGGRASSETEDTTPAFLSPAGSAWVENINLEGWLG